MTILEKIISSKTKELKILKSLNSIKDLENKKLFEKQTFSLKERLELSRHGINPDKFMLVFKSTSKVFKFLLLTPIISID